jgi:hypothetical protein
MVERCIQLYWWRNLKDNLEDVDIDGNIILRDNLKKQNGRYGQGQGADFDEHIYEPWIFINASRFLTS